MGEGIGPEGPAGEHGAQGGRGGAEHAGAEYLAERPEDWPAVESGGGGRYRFAQDLPLVPDGRPRFPLGEVRRPRGPE